MKTKIIAFSYQKLLIFFGFFVIAGVVPALLPNQWITGPLINATLILTCVLLGAMEAIILGIFPSTIALVSGLLPISLAPMIPFIIIGNTFYVTVFHYMKNKNIIVGIVLASIIKFLFLYGTVMLIMNGLLDVKLIEKLSVIMSYPQLITALIGGGMAYGILKVTKNDILNS